MNIPSTPAADEQALPGVIAEAAAANTPEAALAALAQRRKELADIHALRRRVEEEAEALGARLAYLHRAEGICQGRVIVAANRARALGVDVDFERDW